MHCSQQSLARQACDLAEDDFTHLMEWIGNDLPRLFQSWRFLSRPAQRAPDGPWSTWLLMAGRGFGKTRSGAEWIHAAAEAHAYSRIALIGPTLHDVRAVMVEGESGLLNTGPPGFRPDYEPSKRRLTWPSGARAFLFSAEEPDSIRGFNFHTAWGDEIGRWPHGKKIWENLQLALRKGKRPRALLTTTPLPVPLVRTLVAEAGASDRVVVTCGRTADNAANLSPEYLETMTQTYGGTRMGRQELDGELLEDVEGALWTRDLIEKSRAREAPAFRRVVIGVDPPAGSGEGADACGIVVVALGADGRGYVIGDASVQGLTPDGWAGAVCAAAEAFGADKVVAEVNNGGDMVAAVLRAVDAGLPVKSVHASRGKAARAEPVAALYTAGRVSHAGAFPELEDEMCGLQACGGYAGPGRSPDRADALVWALTELMLGKARHLPRVWVG